MKPSECREGAVGFTYSGEMLTIREVRADPPKESFSSRVSLESRYGICAGAQVKHTHTQVRGIQRRAKLFRSKLTNEMSFG
jgi:hypothetical protein